MIQDPNRAYCCHSCSHIALWKDRLPNGVDAGTKCPKCGHLYAYPVDGRALEIQTLRAEVAELRRDKPKLSPKLPDSQGPWWWQSDGESAPCIVHIAYSGCSGDYFATIGQYGWTEPQSVKDMGGLWVKTQEPAMVPFHEFDAAISTTQAGASG